MTKPKRYKRNSAEFKQESLRRATEEGITDKAVCEELGISTRQFRRWHGEMAMLGQDAFPGNGRSRDLEVAALKRDLAQIKNMSDNPRPVLYGSGYDTFLPRAVGADRARTVTVVGKHCESGDVLVRDAAVPADLVVGDILGTAVTGAYGHSMGSNYNKVLRPAVVFASGGDARTVVRRENYDDLLRLDL